MSPAFRCFIWSVAFVCLGIGRVHAQEVVGESVITVTASTVSTYSSTEMDYATAYYYNAEADGFLWQNGTVIRSGSGTGNPVGDGYMSAPTVINDTYEIQTNHWLIAYYFVSGYGYNDPYGYSLIDAGDNGASSDFYAPNSQAYTVPESYWIGSTYVATTSNAPNVTGLQLWSGNPVPGGNGYIVLYGNDLTTYWGPTLVSAGSGVSVSVSYQSPTQINIAYSIDAGASPGANSISVSTLFGSSSQPLTIYPTGTSWVSTFGVSTDGDGNVVLTQADYNTLVSQGYVAAGTGVVIAITQPELYPILTTAIVVVGAAYILYQAAQYIKNLNYDRLTLDYCRAKLVDCLERPQSQQIGSGSTCYGYCTNQGGQWPYQMCPL